MTSLQEVDDELLVSRRATKNQKLSIFDSNDDEEVEIVSIKDDSDEEETYLMPTPKSLLGGTPQASPPIHTQPIVAHLEKEKLIKQAHTPSSKQKKDAKKFAPNATPERKDGVNSIPSTGKNEMVPQEVGPFNTSPHSLAMSSISYVTARPVESGSRVTEVDSIHVQQAKEDVRLLLQQRNDPKPQTSPPKTKIARVSLSPNARPTLKLSKVSRNSVSSLEIIGSAPAARPKSNSSTSSKKSTSSKSKRKRKTASVAAAAQSNLRTPNEDTDIVSKSSAKSKQSKPARPSKKSSPARKKVSTDKVKSQSEVICDSKAEKRQADRASYSALPPIKKRKTKANSAQASKSATDESTKEETASITKRTAVNKKTISAEKPSIATKPAAPGKDTSGKSTLKKKRTFQDHVVAAMIFSCKPYTLKTLAQSLHTTEIALNHLMLSLLDKKVVIRKEFKSKGGKVKELYWANQESKAKEIVSLLPSADDMRDAQQELKALSREQSQIAKEYSLVTQEPSNDEIALQLTEVTAAVHDLKDQLSAMKDRIQDMKQPQPMRGVKPKSAAQLTRERCPRRMKIRINRMRDEWKKRKEKCTDFIEQLSDGMEKRPKDVIRILDLETDEMLGVKIPPKLVVDS